MYKQKNKTYLEKSKHILIWIKRKIILIITAAMLGMSNAIYDEDNMINGNQNHTEQEHKKD
nr:hypothetical protein [Winogradskyella thalassocola]